jgi:hypothetical protein
MKLNELAYEQAQRLVADGRVVLEGRDEAHLHGMLGALMRTTAERRWDAVPDGRRPPA